jgi:Domain of unknown function (DUF4082)
MCRAKLASVALLILFVTPLLRASTINPVVQFSSSSTLTDGRPFTLGYEFTITSTIDINALGYWDDGLQNNHEVGLWDSTGILLTSATVTGTDPITDFFRFQSIPNFILLPGDYVIGGQFLGNSNPFPNQALGVTTISGYTWVTDKQIYGSGLNFPTFSTGGSYGNNGILLVDMSVASTSAPEPSTMVLILFDAGLLLLVTLVFRRTMERGWKHVSY